MDGHMEGRSARIELLRLLASLLVAFALALGCSACGGDSGSGGATTGGAETGGRPAPRPTVTLSTPTHRPPVGAARPIVIQVKR